MQRDYFDDWVGMVDRVFSHHARASAAQKVTLEREMVEPLPNLLIHALYIEDALSRLVDNAIKFTPEEDGGRVQMRIEERDGGVLISISDEGIGIPAAQLSSIFEPFYQIDRDQYEQQGAGVGLAIVKGIVELHSGWIAVEGREHRGSVFSLWLPPIHESNDLSA
jgi:signal transduction histidine kinase